MYHPLQHKRGSTSTRSGDGVRVRRVSSPDVKVRGLTAQRELENGGGETRKRIIRRGSFQGTLRETAGERNVEVHPTRTRSVVHRDHSPAIWTMPAAAAAMGAPTQSHADSTGLRHPHTGGRRSPASTCVPVTAHLSYPVSQTSYERGGDSLTDTPVLLKPRLEPPNTTSVQTSMHARIESYQKPLPFSLFPTKP